MNKTLIPLLISSDDYVIVYEESPRSFIRLFDWNYLEIKRCSVPTTFIDLCYSKSLKSFVFLSEKSLYQFNPIDGLIERINDYYLLKENRSMSSICSMNDRRLLILYRFGEYLDIYPKGKRIWKRRHLCQSINEDIAQIRSSQSKNITSFFRR